ncbi:phage holin, partial [Streptococcus pneumoniae]|nr:phage holin [Streptococcus pneumoniae]
MQQITEIITNGAISILVILAGVVVRAVKEYLVKKGGEKTIKIVEILAKNAVNAVEQVTSETGFKGDEKLEQARAKVRAELTKYNISMTDKDLDTFVESAVKQMNDAWKGQEVMDIDTSRLRTGLPQVGVQPYRQVHAHSTGNRNSTAQNEADYHYRKDPELGFFSHVVGNGRVLQVGPVNNGSWDVGGGWNTESYAAVELIESHST